VSGAERLARARVLLAVAERIASPEDPLGVEVREALTREGALSREGVELALREHLETKLDEDAILARVGEAERCHVVLSANVCTAALRAFVLAVLTSRDVVVRPSRRDPTLATVLVREAAGPLGAHGATLALVGELGADDSPRARGAVRPGDEVHAYGGDAALEAIRRGLPPGTLLRAHGPGFGVALVGADLDLEAAAAGLTRDVVVFDQRGCLSPRLAIVEGGAERALAFARAVSVSLGGAAQLVPRGPLDVSTRAELSTFARTASATGELFEDRDCLVAFDPEPSSLELPPPARALWCVPGDLTAPAEWLSPFIESLTNLGGSVGWRRLDRVRRAPLGAMQRPPLDGPVDYRTRVEVVG
jgi:hypothetical protein